MSEVWTKTHTAVGTTPTSRWQGYGLSAPQPPHAIRKYNRMLVLLLIHPHELTCVNICHATTTVFRPCNGSVCNRCLRRVFVVSLVLDAR